MKDKLKEFFSRRGKLVAVILAVAIGFGISIQFSDRGVQFDLSGSSFSAAEEKRDSRYDLSAQKIFNRVLLQIKDNYVKPDKIDPTDMLVGALDNLQHSIPEVVINFIGGKESPTRLDLAVKDSQTTIKLDKIESLWAMSFQVKSVFQFIEENLDPGADVDYQEIEYAAINGILKSLDPHSTLLPPKHYKEMKTQTGGEFGGLGIVISVRDGQLTVISPIDGTPASKKGIKAKDKIVRIEDESTVNMNLNEAVSMLRGEPGSEVDIWVERKEWPEPKKITITRAVINIKSVTSKELAKDVGYLRIKNFQANTFSDLKSHLKKLKEKTGGLNGMVLDLRDNPGGLLEQAIKVTDKFLKKGTIVSTVGATDKMREKKKASKSGTEPEYPIVVLVNAGSASASEIVSGALQNHERALVIGDKTFGKGTVQVLYEFPDKSALKLTVAHYLTPGGISIQNRGISPDLQLIPVRIPKSLEEGNLDMFSSKNTIRESDLESHLSNKGASNVKKGGIGFLRFLREIEQGDDEQFGDPNEFERDFEIGLAHQLITAAKPTADRSKMLEKIQSNIKESSDEQLNLIAEKLQKFGVDWKAGESPDEPDYKIEVLSPGPGDVMEAGSEFDMKVKLTNTGDKPLYRMKAISVSDNSILEDNEFLFGHVPPGESKTWSVTLNVPTKMRSRHDVVAFEVSDDEEVYGQDFKYPIKIHGKKRPQFAFTYDIDDESKNGLLTKGEEVKLHTYVRNVGQAASKDTLVYLKNQSDSSVFLEKGRHELENLEKGETKKVTFKFRVKEPPEEGESIELRVDVYDTRFQEFIQRSFKIPYIGKSKKDDGFEKVSGTVEFDGESTDLMLEPRSEADLAATAKKGTRLKVVGEWENWYKLSFKDRQAWVKKEAVKMKSDSEPTKLTDLIFFQAPSIDIEAKSKIASAGSGNLDISISDDAQVKDYYVFVYHRNDGTKMQTKKIDYERVDKQSVDVNLEPELFEGMNRISVVARDNEGMETSEETFVYYPDKKESEHLATFLPESALGTQNKPSKKTGTTN